MSLTDITGITFIDELSGTLQGSVGYPVLNATNGIIGFSILPTVDRLEATDDGGVTGIDGGKLGTLVSESDLGWTGVAL